MKTKYKFINIPESLLASSGLLILTYATLKIFDKTNEIQRESYIDEIFHVPQAQLYCNNVWTQWNPKITTLPGLYIVSYVFLKPLELLRGITCSVYSLRLVNVVGTLFNFVLSYLVLSKLDKSPPSKSFGQIIRNLVSAINVAIFPPLYFFTFLYYTDVWSVTFVLLMYYGHVIEAKYLTSLSGFIAVMLRQTNVIWVGFLLMDDIWNLLMKDVKSKKSQHYRFTINALKSFMKSLSFKKSKKGKGKTINIFSLMCDIVTATYPVVFVCVAFVIFVAVNGSIVLGDKNAHKAVFHPMQNLYFLDFAAFFSLPYLSVHIISRKKLPNGRAILLLTAIAIVLSEVNKLEHPYLLADNRHFAFYIWKRIFGHVIVRRIVIPTYAVAGMLLFDLLAHRNFMFRVILGICILLNLSFQHLFELRYFIIPFVMCRLHFQPNMCSLLMETVYFSAINAVTLYIYLNKTFAWDSEPNAVQRFVW